MRITTVYFASQKKMQQYRDFEFLPLPTEAFVIDTSKQHSWNNKIFVVSSIRPPTHLDCVGASSWLRVLQDIINTQQEMDPIYYFVTN
jgi:hypothetical protein